MRSKSRRYVFLLLFSIAVRTFFYFFQFKGTFFEGIAQTGTLYDVIFYSIMISLLDTLKERKWLIGLAWVTMFAFIALDLAEWARPGYITHHRSVARFTIVMSLVFIIFDVSIFFTRKSPARIFFRLMSALLTFEYIYQAYSGLSYSSNPDNWLLSRAGDATMSILVNLLLLLAVLRTSELHPAKYADFLE